MTRAVEPRRLWWALLATALALATIALVAACGGDGGDEGAQGQRVSGRISVAAIWGGQEAQSFQAVIDAFNRVQPDVTVDYQAAGDQLPTVLATAVDGGNPPDVALVAQPGTVRDFVRRGALKPIEYAREEVEANFSPTVLDIGVFDGKLYGVLFKAANKSLGWYNVRALADAGVDPPERWEDLPAAASTLQASGVTPFSVAGAAGWTLTDLFENLYLRIAGPEKYDQLAAHRIPWTDPSVIATLEAMRAVVGSSADLAGGSRGALQTDFPRSVSQVFSDPPRAAITFEGDFVASTIAEETDARAGADFDSFTFPSVRGSAPAVVGGGDIAIAFSDDPATRAFIRFLATPEAAQAWAERGGFLSANQSLDPSVYPDDVTRSAATALADAQTFRFDLSDLQPAAFGATPGQGEWKIFQDFVRDPSDPVATARQLEAAAARAYR